ncbi:SDR family oxidoreductase [Fodinicola acaciae]|uniref:SDR family oxidoreductase n=1 Tax=Fodinicola acaciae TaxID=2681555 RepID=UPI0013D6DE57|nr:SDR family oxidoreductase [Fodinicola acaciae]
MTSTAERDIILITGANKGIGFATAQVLARAGHVVLLGARDDERGQAAAAALGREGLDARFVRLDVTAPTTIQAAAQLIESTHGRLDVLVNNAGISRDRPYGPTDLPIDNLREIYETNVFGVVAVTNAMLPLLRRSRNPRVGNVSSGLGTFAFLTDQGAPHASFANLLGYNSSKAALNAVTVIYANTLRAAGVRVNALSPGYCATDLNEHTGELPAERGGEFIASQVMTPAGGPTGVFLREGGGTYDW